MIITRDTTQTDGGAVDPLAALEKSTEAMKRLNQIERPRIESLQMVSDRYNTDPYTLSTRVRRKFREEKRIEQTLKAKDDEFKRRYGLPETLSLVRDDAQLQEEAKEEFRTARQKMSLAGGSRPTRSTSSAKATLAASLIRNSSLRKRDTLDSNSGGYQTSSLGVSIRK